MYILVSNTCTITIGRSKNKISLIVGISYAPKHKINLRYLLLQQQKLEVIDMADTIPETVSLPLPYSVSDSKEDTAQKLLFPKCHFAIHFKSTTHLGCIFRSNSVYSVTFLTYPAELRYPVPPENGKGTKRNVKGKSYLPVLQLIYILIFYVGLP